MPYPVIPPTAALLATNIPSAHLLPNGVTAAADVNRPPPISRPTSPVYDVPPEFISLQSPSEDSIGDDMSLPSGSGSGDNEQSSSSSSYF